MPDTRGLVDLTIAEHIGPGDTGDNIEAKKVAPYGWGGVGNNFSRQPLPFLTKPFDRLIVTYTDSTKTVIASVVTKLSGATQETLTNSVGSTVDDFQRT